MISTDDYNLEKFGRHVPRVLGEQLISQLVNQYLTDTKALFEPEIEKSCPPSIERFHAALLFVDISGFTILSQRLPVDDLRLHINAYFKKILDICYKYGGDVVKFAGDALFIIWHTPVHTLDGEEFQSAAKLSVERAVSCGLEINNKCSNYKINLMPSKPQQSSQLTSALLEGQNEKNQQEASLRANSVRSAASANSNTFRRRSNASGAASASGAGGAIAENDESKTTTFLSVHSGVAEGVMAGIDVGADSRWEYLLLGQPLNDVAVGESLAKKGELIISPSAHKLLCGEAIVNAGACKCGKPHESAPEPGYCKVYSRRALVDPVNEESPDDLLEYDLYYYAEIMQRAAMAYKEALPAINQLFTANCGGAEVASAAAAAAGISISNSTSNVSAISSIGTGAGGTGGASSTANSSSSTLLGSASAPTLGPALRTSPSFPEGVAEAEAEEDQEGSAADVDQSNKSSNSNNDGDGGGIGFSTALVDTNSSNGISSLSPEVEELLFDHYLGWMQHCLMDDIAVHVHEADRTDYEFKGELREAPLHKFAAWVSQQYAAVTAASAASAASSASSATSPVNTSSRTNFSSARVSSRMLSTASYRSPTSNKGNSSSSSNATGAGGAATAGESDASNFVNKMRTLGGRNKGKGGTTLKEKNRTKNEKIRKQDTSMSAELRNVIVLFINVQIEASSLVFSSGGNGTSDSTKLSHSTKGGGGVGLGADGSPAPTSASSVAVAAATAAAAVEEAMLSPTAPSSTTTTTGVGGNSPPPPSIGLTTTMASQGHHSRRGSVNWDNNDQVKNGVMHSKVKAFHFLDRTEEEFFDDQRIMNSFQDCMEVMTKIFREKGGQMRQFIVDDKGTVCIGTFGLRGSATNDNAAAAISAGGAIIHRLHKIGISASIGVTSGKAYCGIVGSPLRHEYAVMGPSTNLSARLMGKAGLGEMICDGDTRNRDRTHRFLKLSEVQAKGYAKLVPTFKPVLAIHSYTNHDPAVLNQPSLLQMGMGSGSEFGSGGGVHAAGGGAGGGIQAFTSSFKIMSAQHGSHGVLDLMNGSGTVSASGERFSRSGDALVSPTPGVDSPISDVARGGSGGHIQFSGAAVDGIGGGEGDAGGGAGGNSGTVVMPLAAAAGKHPPHRVKKLQKSTTLRSIKSNTQSVPLMGRDSELNEMFSFLFPTFVAKYGPLSDYIAGNGGVGSAKIGTSAMIKEVEDEQQDADGPAGETIHFDNILKTRAVIIQGANGVGKSSFIKMFCDAISNTCIRDRSMNIVVFKYRSTESTNSTPFVAWKSIIRELLLRMAKHKDTLDGAQGQTAQQEQEEDRARGMVESTGNEEDGGAFAAVSGSPQSKKHTTRTVVSNSAELARGLDYCLSLLSPELQQLKPLISSIDFVYGIKDNEFTTKLSGVTKMQRITELLAAIMHQFAVTTGYLILAAIDDLQTVDSASWQLFHHIWEHNNGIAIVASHTPTLTRNNRDLNNFQDSVRLKLQPLNPLDFSVTKRVAKGIFKVNGIRDVEDRVYTRLHEMSGGNALFIYELAKAMMELYLSNVEKAAAQAAQAASLGEDGAGADSSDVAALTYSSFSEAVQDFRTTRIEEVICYRFDQFDTAAQLLLKLASVACANSEPFTLRLLNHMIHDSQHKGSNGLSSFEERERDGEDVALGAASGSYDFEDGDEDKGSSLLAATLETLLRDDEFIRVVHTRSGSTRNLTTTTAAAAAAMAASGDDADESRASIRSHHSHSSNSHATFGAGGGSGGSGMYAHLYTYSFEFKIQLEQRTIYDLMLDEQKQALHERVASFLEQRAHQEESAGLTSTELHEEGFHWERATGWSSAMVCYYQSAMLLDEVGSFQDSFLHLTSAYRMLNAMRNEVGVTEDFHFEPASFQALFNEGKPSAAEDAQKEAEEKEEEEEEEEGLTKGDLLRVFGGDSHLLETGVHVLLRLGQASFSLSDTPAVTSKLYEDALQMIMLTWDWKRALGMENSNHNTPNKKDPSSSSAEETTPEPPAKKPFRRSGTHNSVASSLHHSEAFGLEDPVSVFPILAGIAALYRNNKLADDEKRSKERTLYDIGLMLARTSGAYMPHLVAFMALKKIWLFEMDKMQESITMADGMIQLYDESSHAGVLIKAYGSNRVPYTVAMHVQLLRISGDITKSTVILNNSLQSMVYMTHPHSMAITVFPIISVMLLQGSKLVALEAFKYYLELERERGGYNFFKEINPLFLEALKIALAFEKFTVEKDISYFVEHSATVKAQEIEQEVLDRLYLYPSKEARSMLYDTMTSFGTPVEHCIGFMLLLKARMTLARIDMRKEEQLSLVRRYLEAAIEYEDFLLNCIQDSNRLAFAHFGALVTKACVLVMLANLPPVAVAAAAATPSASKYQQYTVEQFEEEARKSLTACEAIGIKNNYHFIVLNAGVYFEILGIDEKRGRQLQALGLDGMQDINGTKEFAGAFDSVEGIFPIVERFRMKYTLQLDK